MSFDQRYCISFGFDKSRITTIIHYIFRQIWFEDSRQNKYTPPLSNRKKIKIIKQLLDYVRLLIIHNIIDIRWLYDYDEDTIWDVIKQLPHRLIKHNSTHSLWNAVKDNVMDLFVTCTNKQPLDQEDSIFTITRSEIVYDESDPNYKSEIVQDGSRQYHLGIQCKYLWGLMYDDQIIPYNRMENRAQILETLLFRGIIPFQFISSICEYKYDNSTNTRSQQRKEIHRYPTTDCNNNMQKYIQHILTKAKIFECAFNVHMCKIDNYGMNNYQSKETAAQMYLLAPLLLLPHNVRARNKMNGLISECIVHFEDYDDDSAQEISNIISSYIFVDYNQIYPMADIDQNDNCKSIMFLNQLLLFRRGTLQLWIFQ